MAFGKRTERYHVGRKQIYSSFGRKKKQNQSKLHVLGNNVIYQILGWQFSSSEGAVAIPLF